MNEIQTINLDNNVIAKKQKVRSAVGAVCGVSAGLLASVAITKKPMMLKDVFVKNDYSKSLKNLYDYTKVDYEGFKGFLAMVMQATGAAFGSLIGGLSVYKNIENQNNQQDNQQKIEKDKKAKIKEALFMTNNVLIPTAFVKFNEWGIEKAKENLKSENLKNIVSSKLLKAALTVIGLVGGMMTSLSVTNTINNKYIEKENGDNKKMRPLDFIYHVDDIIPILISSKNPICDKLPIDRLLPFIYGYMGSKVGTQESQN